MPDRHRLDLLPSRGMIEVRCIDCHAGGPSWDWPEHKRARHAAAHRAQARQQLARERRARIREADRLRRQAERENQLAYGEQR
jgi:hypothetical protein